MQQIRIIFITLTIENNKNTHMSFCNNFLMFLMLFKLSVFIFVNLIISDICKSRTLTAKYHRSSAVLIDAAAALVSVDREPQKLCFMSDYVKHERLT